MIQRGLGAVDYYEPCTVVLRVQWQRRGRFDDQRGPDGKEQFGGQREIDRFSQNVHRQGLAERNRRRLYQSAAMLAQRYFRS